MNKVEGGKIKFQDDDSMIKDLKSICNAVRIFIRSYYTIVKLIILVYKIRRKTINASYIDCETFSNIST